MHNELVTPPPRVGRSVVSADWLPNAVDQAPGIFLVFDAGGVCLAARGGGLNSIGQTPQDIVGRSAFELPGIMGEDGRAIRRALDGETMKWRVEFARWAWDIFCAPDVDKNGASERISVFASEATTLEKAQSPSPAEAARLRLVIDNLPAAIAYVNIEGRYQFANEKYAEWFQLDHGHLVGSPSMGGLGLEFQCSLRDLLVTLEAGQNISNAVTFTYPDGVTRDVTITIVPDRGENQDMCGALLLHADVTEQEAAYRVLRLTHVAIQESKDRFHTLYDFSALSIVIADLEGRILRTNPACQRMLGLDQTQLVGKYWTSFTDAQDRAKSENLVKIFPASEKPMLRAEQKFVHEDGHQVWTRLAMAKLRSGENAAQSVIVMIEDISDLTTAKGKALQRQSELAVVLRRDSLGELVATLAHELAQPLSAISNFTHGVVRRLEAGTCSNEELIEAARQTVTQADLAGSILTHIRNFLREAQTDWDLLDANEICRSALSLAAADMRDNDIQVSLTLTPALPKIYGNAVELEQVVLNLARNAVDSLKSVSARARNIHIRTDAGENGGVRISVSDNGPGVPANLVGRIFKPFFSSKDEGTGMGLAICRNIVEAHRGSIELQSPYTGRTDFVVTLPGTKSS